MILSNFNWLDYLFSGIFLLFILLSLWRGLIKEIISILAWVAGLFIGFTFAPKLAALFSSNPAVQSTLSSTSETMAGQSSVMIGVCFAVLLIGTLIIGAIINYFMSAVVQASGLSIFNRLLGGIFGFLKAFIIEVVIVFFVQMTAYAESPIWKNSEFVKAYQPVIASLENKFGSNVDDLKTKIKEMGVSQIHS